MMYVNMMHTVNFFHHRLDQVYDVCIQYSESNLEESVSHLRVIYMDTARNIEDLDTVTPM